MLNPRLSLCMIIRDEEKMLPQFLQHADGLWDELCVIDTGSVDRSMEILQAAGAKIEQRPWQGDFAAARNVSLDMATGDWILFLDADEMISSEAIQQIRDLLSQADAGAAKIIMRNRMPQGHRHDTPLLRLFRNDPSIRFKSRIHEEVSTTTKAYLKKTGKKLVLLTGIIDHLGYVRTVAAEKGKKERDRELLEKCLQDDPADLYSHFKLLELAKFWLDHKMLQEAAERALKQVEQLGKANLNRFADAGELIALIAEGIAAGDPGRMLQVLQGWPQQSSASFLLRRGEAFELTGQADAAEQDFRACLMLGHDQMLQLVGIRPNMGLARLAMARGDLRQAVGFVEKALTENPRDLEALLAAVALHRSLGAGELEKFVSEHTKLYGDVVELSRAIGEEAFLRGDFSEASSALKRAVKEEQDDNSLQIMFAQSLLATGSLDGAQDHCRQLLDSYPAAAAGLIVCGLIKGEDLDFSVDIELEPLSQALFGWIEVLKKSPHPRLLETFIAMTPAVTHLFPWLEELSS